MEDWLSVLKREFDAEDGSFFLAMRCDLTWDSEAFKTLTEAMLACCKARSGDQSVERWIANGYWYLSRYVRDWTTHEDFPRRHGNDYYEKSCRQLNDLAFWFFFDECPYESGKWPY